MQHSTAQPSTAQRGMACSISLGRSLTYPACHHHHHHGLLVEQLLLLAGYVDAEHPVWHQPKWTRSMLEHRLPASRTAT